MEPGHLAPGSYVGTLLREADWSINLVHVPLTRGCIGARFTEFSGPLLESIQRRSCSEMSRGSNALSLRERR